MADNLKLSPEAIGALDEEEQLREVENLELQSSSTPYDESIATSLFRRLYGGITGGCRRRKKHRSSQAQSQKRSAQELRSSPLKISSLED
jgi:hypothetical protein